MSHFLRSELIVCAASIVTLALILFPSPAARARYRGFEYRLEAADPRPLLARLDLVAKVTFVAILFALGWLVILAPAVAFLVLRAR